ncbi:hypothetical protein BDB00DRAFT_751618, partial [Zychaea mexicana]|uniref:uncharacterized protein n=1 Tax=Zychaea mexicana TaxID=64656 RepID=UPI0022FEDCDE
WTNHCGIVSLSADLKLSQISALDNPRHLLVQVEHKQQHFQPFYILTIYAPATSPTQRRQFFGALYHSAIFDQQQPYRERLILTGDFNYSLQRPGYHLNAPQAWFNMLQHQFTNCITPDQQESPQPTFRRGDSTMSTIDYIYAASSAFQNTVKTREVSYVASSWSDHALLSTTYNLGPAPTGKGYWQGNPLILTFKDFRRQLATQLTAFFEHTNSNSTPQHQWEELKRLIKHQMQQYCRQRISRTSAYLNKLQSKRNRFLRSNPTPAARTWFLNIIEQQISAAQQEVCDTLALRAGKRW